MRVMEITGRVVAGIAGGAVVAIMLFYWWWMMLYIVPPIILAGNVPRLMSGEDTRLVVEAMLAFAVVDGAITAVGIFMATRPMVGEPGR